MQPFFLEKETLKFAAIFVHYPHPSSLGLELVTYIKGGYTVQHCMQYCAQQFLLDVATRSQRFVQHYAQYLKSGYQDIGFL